MKPHQAGFTLVELLITLTVFVLVMLALFVLYDNYGTVFGSQQALFKIAGSAASSAADLQQTIMEADMVVGSHVFASGAYSTNATTLVLELPAMEPNGEPKGTWDYVVFYVDNGKLYKLTEAAPGSNRTSALKQLSDTLAALTFTYDNVTPAASTKVDMDITTQARHGHNTQTYHLHQQVYLRNL